MNLDDAIKHYEWQNQTIENAFSTQMIKWLKTLKYLIEFINDDWVYAVLEEDNGRFLIDGSMYPDNEMREILKEVLFNDRQE